LVAKWWNKEGWRIPTASAMSRVDVPWKPRVANRRDAAVRIRSCVGALPAPTGVLVVIEARFSGLRQRLGVI
jgi:hypothetical protein